MAPDRENKTNHSYRFTKFFMMVDFEHQISIFTSKVLYR